MTSGRPEWFAASVWTAPFRARDMTLGRGQTPRYCSGLALALIFGFWDGGSKHGITGAGCNLSPDLLIDE